MNSNRKNNIIKRAILACVVVVSAFNVQAQQDAMFTHYMMNTLAVNPAYAGSREALTMTALGRRQWVGFPGSPKTGTYTLHSPLLNNKLGVGLSFIADQIGPTNNGAVYGDFAYKIKVNDKGDRLAFGIKGGINFFNRKPISSADLTDGNIGNDPNLQQTFNSKIQPNFGAGVYYYAERFYVGLSTPKFLQNAIGADGTTTGGTNTLAATQKRHYFFIAGAMLKVNEMIDIKPTTFVKVTAGAPIEADITAMAIFSKKLNLGLGYRTNDALSILLGYDFTDQLYAGYSYDFSLTNRTGKYNSGSHEIVLRYDMIFKDKGRIKSPRYF